MKVFVSGASGFVGRAVVSDLSKRGHEVIGLARNDEGGRIVKAAGGIPVIGDLFHGGAWCKEVQEVDKVISLTQPFKETDSIPLDRMEEYGNRHAEGVTNLIKAAAEGSAKGIIVDYHTNCYGDRKGKWVEADAGAVDPVGYCRPLTGSIDTIESVLEDSGLAAVTVFTGMVYGNGGWFKRLVGDIQAGKARIIEPGDNLLNIIHIEDAANLFSLITERVNESDVFIMSDSRPFSQRTLIESLAALLDKPVPAGVNMKEYEKQFGLMAMESMSCNTKTSAEKLLSMFEYRCKYKSYEAGFPAVLKSMGIEPMKEEFRRVA